ncbi:MAG TPA: hypothetical protein VH023_15065, partial [Rhodopila sp.]|nr:hypothetical protein [Rhodopila sp.]
MSLAPTRGESPFVRGTTNPAVFFLQAGQARLVPDAATLAFISAGQAVRTLTDVAMAALPRGAALPSRADGTLLTALVPIAAGAPPMAYLMAGGLKRHVPDTPTLNALETAGALSHTVTVADLAGIPDGAAMPSRADGVVYQGSGGAYAFLMRGGLRAAVPDATTLRDGGHDPATALAITAADLAAIPNAAPLSSTSRFLHPPAADTPLLLLPVRLETRFQGNELWLRIYPDDIHVNSFEPQLTADETAARVSYLDQAKAGPQAAQTAFAALVRQFGAERAAWIASATAQPGAKPAQWTRAPHVDVLPERWIVMGYQTDGPGQLLFVGAPITDTLAVGPDPNGSGPTTDDGMRWLSDFDRAVQVGMGCRIPLTGAQTRGFRRLLVFGLRTGVDPAQAAARFGDLLQAHHYTDGLELLAHGTPTNNTEDAASGLTSHDPNGARLFAVEQGAALCP